MPPSLLTFLKNFRQAVRLPYLGNREITEGVNSGSWLPIVKTVMVKNSVQKKRYVIVLLQP